MKPTIERFTESGAEGKGSFINSSPSTFHRSLFVTTLSRQVSSISVEIKRDGVQASQTRAWADSRRYRTLGFSRGSGASGPITAHSKDMTRTDTLVN